MIAEGKRQSLVFKFSLQITLILFLLLAVLILSNLYSFNVIRSNIESNARYTMGIHINNIEHSLGSVTKDLTEIYENNLDSAALYPHEDSIRKYLEAMRWKNELMFKVASNDNIDALYISSPSDDVALAEFNKRIAANEKLAIFDFMKERDSRDSPGTEWSILRLTGSDYLLKEYRVSGMRFGALVKCDSLMSIVMQISDAQYQYVLTDHKGDILSASNPALLELDVWPNLPDRLGKRDGTYYMSEKIPAFGGISTIIESGNVFSKLAYVQWMIILLGVVSLIVVPIVLYRLSREIILPVLALVKATKEVEIGNWDYRVPENGASLEFAKLFHSFTSMIKEIKELKIQSYEEKLERNKAELKYLQMQIKPHFFLNAITTISNLTYQNKNEDIRRLIQSLSKYLRYMFKGGLASVTVTEEIEHVENYIRLQELRFPNRIFYMVEADRWSESRKIPQFLIQTFVENIFKHAMSAREMLAIFIKVERCRELDEDYVRIVIEDNGDGFTEDTLREINGEEIPSNATGNHIGINNIKMTLRLLYRRSHLLKAANREPSGAVVEVRIPVTPTGKDEELAMSAGR
jgi:methyl-accepting chemotaxis protein